MRVMLKMCIRILTVVSILGAVRDSELARVREIYVPELIIRLHRCLYESRSLIPRYVHNHVLVLSLHYQPCHAPC